MIVDNGKLILKKHHIDKLKNRDNTNFGWQDLVQNGIVEYIGKLKVIKF